MDKNKIIQAIKEAEVSDDLKQELIEIVESEKAVSQDVIQKINDRLDGEAEAVIQEIGDIMVDDALEEHDEETAKIDQELNDLQEEVETKTNDIDIAVTRAKIADGIN